MKSISVFLSGLLLLTACAAPVKPLYYWGNYNKVSHMAVKKNEAKDITNLMTAYDEIMSNVTKGQRGVPPPGICADYGFFLMSNGEFEKGKDLLNKEITYYPESKAFIERIIKMTELTK